MFDVSAGETIQLAEAEGFGLTLKLENQPGSFGRTDVSWTRLAFSNVGKRADVKLRHDTQPTDPPPDVDWIRATGGR